MKKFTKAIELGHNGLLQKIPQTKNFMVKENFVWYVDYANRKYLSMTTVNYEVFPNTIIVPILFETDLGSIPGIGRMFIRHDKYISFILHDYMLSDEFKDKYPYIRSLSYCTYRHICDKILLEAMIVEGAGWFDRAMVYTGVRLGAYASAIKKIILSLGKGMCKIKK